MMFVQSAQTTLCEKTVKLQ